MSYRSQRYLLRMGWNKMAHRRGYQRMLRSRIVIPLLETNLLDLPRLEFLKCNYAHGSIREQVNLPILVECDLDRAVVNPIVDPVFGDLQPLRDLRHGELAGNPPRMRLAPFDEQPMAKANDPDRADQHGRTFRRTMPVPSQVLSD